MTRLPTAPVHAEAPRLLMLIFADGVGGMERRVSMLADALEVRGVRCEFVALRSSSAARGFLAHREVRVLDAERGRSPWLSVRRWSRLRTLLRATTYHAVLSFGQHANALACVAAIGTGQRVVINEIGNPFLARRRRWNRTVMHAYRLADMLVLQTQRLADEMRQQLPVPGTMAVLPNPVHPDAASPPPAPGRPRVIVGLGRLVRNKRYGDLLEAFARLASQHPDWRLVIMGDGPERVSLIARAQALGLADRVSLPGVVPAPWPQLRAASVLVHCSEHEGFCNTILEALSTGCAVIASDSLYGTREILQEGALGVLYPVGDVDALTRHLEQLLSDHARRDALAQAGHAEMTQYSVAAIADQWMATLQLGAR